jgi:hypothetical protein
VSTGGWQPIDSAPKDGSRILIYGCANCGGLTMHTARFKVERGAWIVSHNVAMFEPTHWMPLPEPPEGI